MKEDKVPEPSPGGPPHMRGGGTSLREKVPSVRGRREPEGTGTWEGSVSGRRVNHYVECP